MRTWRPNVWLTFYAPARARDSYGGMAPTWTERVTDVAGERLDEARDSFFAALQERERVTIGVRIRWRRDIKTTWRATTGTETLEVVALRDPEGDRRWLMVYFREVR